MSSLTVPPGRNESVTHLVDVDRLAALDLMGVEIRYLTEPGAEDELPCILRGVIPPGVVVPLHMHADPEIFFQLSGEMEGLSMSDDGFEWIRVRPGDVFHIPDGARHALRNVSDEPSIAFLTTTSKMGRFFKEIGTPGGPGSKPPEETVRHFLETAARYGYWNATPEENARIGISL
ncbi:MAG: cupin domain-containing protein [Pseudaminobacter sp.]